MNIKIYHNPRCSKSRQTMALLEEQGVAPDVTLYLETPPSKDELEEILTMLGIEPRELMRKGEAEYKELNLADPGLDRGALLDAMVKHPILIERPIVVKDGKAALGRPPERVLELF